MTEEIIIDGVDVAKCRYFTSEWDFNNCGHICKETECKYKRLWYKKQLKRKVQECEELKKQVEIFTRQLEKANREVIKEKEKNATQRQENGKLEQTLDEIIRFFKEDEKFARYSGRPIIFAKPTLEKIEKILKENDIKIS